MLQRLRRMSTSPIVLGILVPTPCREKPPTNVRRPTADLTITKVTGRLMTKNCHYSLRPFVDSVGRLLVLFVALVAFDSRSVAQPPVEAASPPNAVPAEKSAAAANDPPKMVRLEFQEQKWLPVLEWLAKNRDLNLDWQQLPEGTLNLASTKEYTRGGSGRPHQHAVAGSGVHHPPARRSAPRRAAEKRRYYPRAASCRRGSGETPAAPIRASDVSRWIG